MRSKLIGLKVTYEARHEDGKGRLICVDKTHKFKLWRGKGVNYVILED